MVVMIEDGMLEPSHGERLVARAAIDCGIDKDLQREILAINTVWI